MELTPLVLAAEAGPVVEAGRSASGLVRFALDHPFALALTFVFLVALVGAFVAARKRDRCLKRFRGFTVTLREQAGRHIWGRLKVFSKGLELVFETPYDRPAKHSFLVYEAELGRVLMLYRFADRLSGPEAARRRRQVRNLAEPPLLHRAWRWVRNIVNTFRDATIQAFGMTVQQAAKTTPSPILQSQGGQVNALGSLLIGETANAYEPILEQYIGKPVILEVTNPADPAKAIVEYHGYLGEYSAQFVLLGGVRRRFQEAAPLDGTDGRFVEGLLGVRGEGRAAVVENRSAVPAILEGVHVGQACHEINRTVAPGETARVPLPEGVEPGEARAAVSFERAFDLIVPRACGVIRHASADADRAGR